MRIRWKLLILLLAITLVPLVGASVLHRVSMHRLGGRLAEGTRSVLTDTARHDLRVMVGDYARILRRDREKLELVLRCQAEEVERRLAADPPASARLFHAADFDRGTNLPAGMQASDRHYRRRSDGSVEPMQVTYREQVYFVVAGVDERAVADDMRRLSTMPQAYRSLRRYFPQALYWQYTALESGLHTSYPGHGGYPRDYDPRTRPWYRRARRQGESLQWLPPIVDVTTRKVILTLSMPVRRPDGRFAGVTALDVPLTGIFEELSLPQAWSREAVTILAAASPTARRAAESREAGIEGGGTRPQSKPAADGRLVILVQKSYAQGRRNWRTPVELELLEADDASDLAALQRDALAGRTGVRRMSYRGRDCLWAYGAGRADQPFPIVIVPHETITAQAAEAEQYVLDKTFEGVTTTGAILLGVIVLVAVAALVSSRFVTRPVRELAEAAQRLAGGDYDARVEFARRDELGELAAVFNDTGPKLRERERMKRSLELAMEIQQHLLPDAPPAVDGFDVAGHSDYCDETGGDYYDFIELVDLGEGKVGVAVGDVTGHGIGAALLMASARGVLRSHAGRYGTDLTGLFKALNEHLVRDTGEDRFMTLFYAVLDGPARSLWWTSGGHDPALWLRRAGGRIDELPNTGIPLGVLDGVDYEQGGPVTLEAGDVVLIGTDGIWEASNPAGEMYGKERLRALLSSAAARTAAEIRSEVVRCVHAFRSTHPQQDDITLVVIKAL